MNERLSRLDRYGHRNRPKQRKSPASVGTGESSGNEEPRPDAALRQSEPAAYEAGARHRDPVQAKVSQRPGGPFFAETQARLHEPSGVKSASRAGESGLAKNLSQPFESAAVAALAKLREPARASAAPGTREAAGAEGETPFGELPPAEEKSRLLLADPDPLMETEMGRDIGKLPTRKELFPSQRLKMTKWFYNSLLYIFMIILIYLLWWGLSDSPWGQSHGL